MSRQSRSEESIPDANVALANLPPLEKVPTISILPPPDVGFRPWLQVTGGFFLMFNTWGIVVAFGTFQVNERSQFNLGYKEIC